MYRFLSALVIGALVIGCGKKAEEPAASEPAASEPMVEEANTLANYAGEWALQALSNSGDVLVELGMTATDSPEGWAMKFNHLSDPVPGSAVEMRGDSVVVAFGPYWSALQDQVMVTTTSVLKAEANQLSGRFTAVYTNGTPPVLNGRLVGTRVTQ